MIDPLSTAPIGRTTVAATRLGLGTAPLGGWPTAITHEDAVATIAGAWDLGIRYFDTAPFYGYGQSERLVGEVLSSKARDQFILGTKVGRLLVPDEEEPAFFQGDHHLRPRTDYSADGARRSLEESLERLGMDRVDVVLVHDPDDHLDEALDGAFVALAEMRAEGTIGAIGAGMNWSEPLAYLARRVDVDCVLLAGRYTLFEQDALDELLPLAEERGFSIVAGGVFNSGLLIDPKPGATYNYAPAGPEVVARAVALKEACARFGVELRHAALHFPLAHPSVATIVAGARTAAEIEENATLLRTPVPEDLWAHLAEEGLIRKDAPLP